MFVCSFKASTVKIICAAFLCIAASVFVIALMPDAGSAMNVNKMGAEQKNIKSVTFISISYLLSSYYIFFSIHCDTAIKYKLIFP